MFDNLVQSAMFPALLEILDAAEKSLLAVKSRLAAQTGSKDRITAIVAQAQLDAIDAWEPMLAEMKMHLDISHERVHGKPIQRER